MSKSGWVNADYKPWGLCACDAENAVDAVLKSAASLPDSKIDP